MNTPQKGKPLPFKQYIWQLEGFPQKLTWEGTEVHDLLLKVIQELGRLSGKVESMSQADIEETYLLNAIGAIKDSSAIEGELLHYHDVRSSVVKQLGIQRFGLTKTDARTDAVVKMMTSALDTSIPLSEERLFTWHGLLFPEGPRPEIGLYHVASYRSPMHDPMVVVSGQVGKEKVHFQAPPAEALPNLMSEFIVWCKQETQSHPIIKSAVAHFWFVTLHPFDDGNGRLARAIGDYFLAQADKLPHRFYSLSSAILRNRKQYYHALELNQKGGLDISHWLCWYLATLLDALTSSLDSVEKVMAKTRFWLNTQHLVLNPRQKKVLNLLFSDFKGLLKTDKYAKLTNSSQDTASRDLKQLLSFGILRQVGQGKATSYELNL